MFTQSILSLALVVLVEAISAVVEYLRTKLMSHINRDNGFGYSQYA